MVTLPTYHIYLICTAIKSPPQGGLLPEGALFSPAKWPWYGLHMAVVKKAFTTCLYQVCYANEERRRHSIVPTYEEYYV